MYDGQHNTALKSGLTYGITQLLFNRNHCRDRYHHLQSQEQDKYVHA